MVREHVLNPIHLTNKLGQQYVVDQYCKMELQRMRFIRNNQTALRSDLYMGLADNLNANDVDIGDTGRPVFLPSSYTGGDRYMHQQLQDSMTIAQRYSTPHLFITITANTKWPEILAQLKPRQTPQDRFDILNRVFEI
jgi:hypothetical protein